MPRATLSAAADEVAISQRGVVAAGLVGTFVGTVLLQIKDADAADSTYRTQKTFTAAPAADVAVTLGPNETARLTMSAYTSGSVVATLSYLGAHSGRFPGYQTFDAVDVNASGNLAVSGNATVTGSLTVTGNEVVSAYRSNSVATGLTAAGTTRADALQLAKQINNVTTAAASTGVILPAVSTVGVGGVITVLNAGANAIKVYGSGSDTIDGVAAATGVTLTNAKRCQYIATAAATWVSAQLGVVSA